MENAQANALINPNKIDFPNILKVFKPDPRENPAYAEYAVNNSFVLIDIIDYTEPQQGQSFFYNFVQKNIEIIEIVEKRDAKGEWNAGVPTWYRCLGVVR
jgi:hypothetical protein